MLPTWVLGSECWVPGASRVDEVTPAGSGQCHLMFCGPLEQEEK